MGHNNTLKTPLYSNCHVQNPDGVHIFNAGIKKAKWYIKRNLAEIIQEHPLIIRLKFVPNGNGHAYDIDSFYLQDRQNICVCCGTNKHITRHHIVPIMYRKFFNDGLKNHSSYDILPLCHSCHENYEISAQKFKTELAEKYMIKQEIATIIDTKLAKVCMAASAILKYGNKIPAERYLQLTNIIKEYNAISESGVLTGDKLIAASLLKYNLIKNDYKPEGQLVVESIKDINAFIVSWRNHFLTTLKPRYLPIHWKADREI